MQKLNKAELDAAFIYDGERGTLTRRVVTGRSRANAATRLRAGYPVTSFNGVVYSTHRIVYIMEHGEIPEGMEIDHINQDKLDFRSCNLRAVPRFVNMENRDAMRNNTSGFKGVSYHIRRGAWFGRKMMQGVRRYTAPCATAQEAYNALQSF